MRDGVSAHLRTLRALLCIAVAAVHITAVAFLCASWASRTYKSADLGYFYGPVAENLLAGRGLVDAEGDFAVRYPPGQPLFLAGLLSVSRSGSVDPSLVFIVANGVLVAACVFMVVTIGEGLAGAAVGLLAGAVFGLHPLYIWLSREPLSEGPFAFLLLLGCWMLVRPLPERRVVVHGLLGGIVLGISALFRPSGLVAVPWILGMCVFGRQDRTRMRFLVAALIGFALAVAPWTLYASWNEGSFVLLSTGGRLSHLDGMKRFPGTAAGNAFIAIEPRVVSGELGTLGAHWRIMAQSPLSYIGLWITKAGRAWYATDEGWGQNLTALCVVPLALLGAVGYVATRSRTPRFQRLSLGWLLLLVWAMNMLVLTIVRYMVPVLWIPCVFAAALLCPPQPGSWAGTRAVDEPSGGGPEPPFRKGLPRAMEIAVAAAGLVVLAPVMALIAAAVRLGGPGPVFFAQKRTGRNGATFNLLKFRTMRPDPAADSAGFEPGGNTRVTPVGRVLRRWKLDEIPQLRNVLRGEMSLVGPRPEIPRLTALYTPEQSGVLRVRPGITDPASIRFRDEETILAAQADPDRYYREVLMPLKLRINLDYLARRSPWTDLAVLGRTVSAALAPSAAQRVESSTARENA